MMLQDPAKALSRLLFYQKSHWTRLYREQLNVTADLGDAVYLPHRSFQPNFIVSIVDAFITAVAISSICAGL